jgi:hypothetical protein
MALRSSFSVPQYTSDVIVVSCCMNSTISTSALLSAPENSCHQLSGRETFVKTFSACSVIVYACTALTPLWFQHSQMKPSFFTCYSYNVIEKFIAIFVVSI